MFEGHSLGRTRVWWRSIILEFLSYIIEKFAWSFASCASRSLPFVYSAARNVTANNGSQFSVQHLGTSFHSSLRVLSMPVLFQLRKQQQRRLGREQHVKCNCILFLFCCAFFVFFFAIIHRQPNNEDFRSSRQRRSLRLVLASEERRRRKAKLKIRANVKRFLLALTEPFSILDIHDVSNHFQSNFLACPPETALNARQKDFWAASSSFRLRLTGFRLVLCIFLGEASVVFVCLVESLKIRHQIKFAHFSTWVCDSRFWQHKKISQKLFICRSSVSGYNEFD